MFIVDSLSVKWAVTAGCWGPRRSEESSPCVFSSTTPPLSEIWNHQYSNSISLYLSINVSPIFIVDQKHFKPMERQGKMGKLSIWQLFRHKQPSHKLLCLSVWLDLVHCHGNFFRSVCVKTPRNIFGLWYIFQWNVTMNRFWLNNYVHLTSTLVDCISVCTAALLVLPSWEIQYRADA